MSNSGNLSCLGIGDVPVSLQAWRLWSEVNFSAEDTQKWQDRQALKAIQLLS